MGFNGSPLTNSLTEENFNSCYYFKVVDLTCGGNKVKIKIYLTGHCPTARDGGVSVFG